MAPPRVGERPHEFKYGMALYGAAWPPGPHYFVCGGGGHGLVPRIVWAKFEEGTCTDQVGDFKLGKQTPMRMALCPSGVNLLLANAEGGLRRFYINRKGPRPLVNEMTASFADQLACLSGEVKAMAFGCDDGTLLALGFETGCLTLVEFPSMRVLHEFSLPDGIKDVSLTPFPARRASSSPAFWRQHLQLQAALYGQSHASGEAAPPQLPPHLQQPGAQQQPHTQQWREQRWRAVYPRRLGAVTCEDGSCRLFDVEAREVVAQLQPPPGLDRARFTRCRWARHGAPVLFVTVNQGREASWLAAYTHDPATAGGGGGGWRCVRRVKIAGEPNSAFEVSPDGRRLAAGAADGSLVVFDALTLERVDEEPHANSVFVTAVAFASDSRAVMAVGADANCYVMELAPPPERRGGGAACMGTLLVLGLLLGLAYQALQWRPELAQQLSAALAPLLEHDQVAPLVAAATPAAAAAHAAMGQAVGHVAAGVQQAWQWARDEL